MLWKLQRFPSKQFATMASMILPFTLRIAVPSQATSMATDFVICIFCVIKVNICIPNAIVALTKRLITISEAIKRKFLNLKGQQGPYVICVVFILK